MRRRTVVAFIRFRGGGREFVVACFDRVDGVMPFKCIFLPFKPTESSIFLSCTVLHGIIDYSVLLSSRLVRFFLPLIYSNPIYWTPPLHRCSRGQTPRFHTRDNEILGVGGTLRNVANMSALASTIISMLATCRRRLALILGRSGLVSAEAFP